MNMEDLDIVDEALYKYVTILGISTNDDIEKLIDYGTFSLLITIASKPLHSVVLDKICSLIYKFSTSEKARDCLITYGVVDLCAKIISLRKTKEACLNCCKILTSVGLVEEVRKTSFHNSYLDNELFNLLSYKTEQDPVSCEVSNETMSHALLAIANCVYDNNTNKLLISSKERCDIIKNHISKLNDPALLASPAALIVNATHLNHCVSHNFLVSETIDVLIKACAEIEDFDEVSDTQLLQRVMMICANIASGEPNLSLVMSTGAADLIIKIISTADDASILREAAIACASLSYYSRTLRRHFIEEGLVPSLVSLILRYGLYDRSDKESEECLVAESASWALTVLIMEPMAKNILESSFEDIKSLVQLYLQTESKNHVLIAGAMVLTELLPGLQEMRRLSLEGRKPAVLYADGDQVLEKCLDECYSDDVEHSPPWLKDAIQNLEKLYSEKNHGSIENESKLETDGLNVTFDSVAEPSKYFTQKKFFQSILIKPGI